MKRLESEYLPYEWMKKDLGLAGAELVLFAAICENRFGLLDGPADYAAAAKKLGMGKSTYFLSRKQLLERGLIRLVRCPGGSLIRLTDKSLILAEKDPRLASLYVKKPFTVTTAKPPVDEILNNETVKTVLSSLADILNATNSAMNSILASLRAIVMGDKKTDGEAAQKTEKAEQLGLFD